MHYFINGCVNKIGIIRINSICHIFRERLSILCQFLLNLCQCLYCIGITGERNTDSRGRMSPASCNKIICTLIQYNSGYILQLKQRAIFIGSKNNIPKLFRCLQTPFRINDILQCSPLGNRRSTNNTTGNLLVLSRNSAYNLR